MFSIVFQYGDVASTWNPHLRKIRNRLSHMVNSLDPGRPWCHFKTAIFNLVLLIGIFTSSNDNALRWMSIDLTDDKSALVQVMACCRQANSHYLHQCWPRSLPPYSVTRPQWVNITAAGGKKPNSAIQSFRWKHALNPNLVKCLLTITYLSVTGSLWNFVRQYYCPVCANF